MNQWSESESEKPATRRNWLYIISPCIIAAFLTVISIVGSYMNLEHSEGWSLLVIIVAVPFLLIMISIDLIVKMMIRKNVLYLWIVEVALVACAIFLVKYYYG